jgi:hypothetical protein
MILIAVRIEAVTLLASGGAALRANNSLNGCIGELGCIESVPLSPITLIDGLGSTAIDGRTG